MTRRRVLVLCTGNSARSQMAEGLLRHDFGDRVEVASAGTHPSGLRPEAVTVMREIGIDISAHRSTHVDACRGVPFDEVWTVCSAAEAGCPVFPGAPRHRHRDFTDPAAAGGTEAERLAVFRRVRDELRVWIAEVMRTPAGGP